MKVSPLEDGASIRCVRFLELDWYDGYVMALCQVVDLDGVKVWLLADRLAERSLSASEQTRFLYVCTPIDAELELSGGTRYGDDGFVETGWVGEAEPFPREALREGAAFIAEFSGDYRRIERVFAIKGVLRSGSEAWDWCFGRPIAPA